MVHIAHVAIRGMLLEDCEYSATEREVLERNPTGMARRTETRTTAGVMVDLVNLSDLTISDVPSCVFANEWFFVTFK